MDKYGVDIACLLPEALIYTTCYTSRWVSNGDMAKVVETNPDRLCTSGKIRRYTFL